MLQYWMSDKPEKAVQSFVKYYQQIEKTISLQKQSGGISVDEYADESQPVLRNFIASLKSKKSLEKVKNNLRHDRKIYRGLKALAYLMNGTDEEGKPWRNRLSDNANYYLTSFTTTLYGDLFKQFLPRDAESLQERLLTETDPERSNQSKQEVEDIKAAFSALKKVK